MQKHYNKKILIVLSFLQVLLLFFSYQSISNCYNIGIKNKGISSIIPNNISSKTYDEYTLLMDSNEFETFDKSYKYDEKKDLYKISKYDKKTLLPIIKKILPIHYLLYQGLQNGKSRVLGLSDYKNIYNILEGYNEKQKNKYLKTPLNYLDKYSINTINNLTVKEIQREYQSQGLNINQIKNNYIKKNIILITVYLVGLLVISIIIKNVLKKKQENYNNIILGQDLILLLLIFIYLLKTSLPLSIIFLVIYTLILGFIYYINNFRKKNINFNRQLSKLEDLFNIEKLINRNNNLIFNLIIVLFVVNLYIFLSFSSYHLFNGANPSKILNNCMVLSFLIFSIFIYRNIIFIVLNWFINNRPKEVLLEKSISNNKFNGKKKKKKKKKKSKK